MSTIKLCTSSIIYRRFDLIFKSRKVLEAFREVFRPFFTELTGDKHGGSYLISATGNVEHTLRFRVEGKFEFEIHNKILSILKENGWDLKFDQSAKDESVFV